MHPILRAFRQGLSFLPRRRSFYRIDGLEFSPQRLGAAELVLARALCRFSRFDFNRLPAGKRAAALALQVPSWSPYADTGYVAIWTEAGEAMVWCWDAAALEASLHAQGLKSRQFVLLPEAVLQPPLEQGTRWVWGLDGLEAQHWIGGQLQASRWWPAMPTERERLAFLRDAGVQADEASMRTDGQALVLLQRPWARVSTSGATVGVLQQWEMIAYALTAIALGAPALNLAVEQFRLGQGSQDVQAQMAQLSEAARAVLLAREQAVEAAQELRALHELQRFPPPLVHMVAIARALPEGGTVFIKEWEASEGKLTLLLASATQELSGAELVRAMEQTKLFTEVKIVTQADPRQLGFIMSLRPQVELAPESAVGALAQER